MIRSIKCALAAAGLALLLLQPGAAHAVTTIDEPAPQAEPRDRLEEIQDRAAEMIKRLRERMSEWWQSLPESWEEWEDRLPLPRSPDDTDAPGPNEPVET
ncbi:MAG: hypothetical protein QNJ92_13005 [Alphaproteobacteria bacterium]|nr:hypothetical protein [Alphaproteobacteria bacterium]